MGTAKEEWDKLSEEEQALRLKDALKGKPREERLAEQERENLKKSPAEFIHSHIPKQSPSLKDMIYGPGDDDYGRKPPVVPEIKHKLDEEFLAETFHNTKDPHGTPQHDPGAKNDNGKTRPGLVMVGFPRALVDVARVSTMGARKYSDGGWQYVPNGVDRYTDAMYRHFLAFYQGETLDPESGLNHLAHAAWNALAVLELVLRDVENVKLAARTGRPLEEIEKRFGPYDEQEKAFRKNNDFRNVDTSKEFTGTGEYD